MSQFGWMHGYLMLKILMLRQSLSFLTAVFMVSNLISNSQWKIEFISVIFNQQDNEEILKISLAASRSIDRLCWKFERKGSYFVKSTYKSLVCPLIPHVQNHDATSWMKLWRLNLPPHIKNFIQRASNNFVPCRTQLVSRCLSFVP